MIGKAEQLSDSTDAIVGTQSLDRGLSVLMLVSNSAQPGLSLAACTTALGLSKATTLRMLQTLVRRGFLDQDGETGLYNLGPTTIHLGAEYLRRIDVRDRALPHMRALVSATGETAHLGVLRGSNVVYVELVQSEVPVRIFSEIGDAIPAYATAAGKAILSWIPHNQVRKHLPKVLEARTPHTITSIDRLFDDIRETRERGYAIDRTENRENVRGFAAPILDHNGDVVAAIAVAAPSERITDELEGRMIREVRRAARLVSLEMGMPDPTAGSDALDTSR